MINNYNISEIEEAVIEIVRSLNVSKKVYPNRPKSSESSADFVVVSVGDGVDDMSAYGECNIDIDLFAKDIDHIKNSKKLSVMYEKLVGGFPASSGRLLFSTEWNILGDTPDDYGYHARLIRIKTIVKAY